MDYTMETVQQVRPCPGRTRISDGKWYVPIGRTHMEATYCEECMIKGYFDVKLTTLVQFPLENCNCDCNHDAKVIFNNLEYLNTITWGNNRTLVKYMDIVQCDMDNFNNVQKTRQSMYKAQYGQKALDDIMHSYRHHPLKSHRSQNYRLSPTDMEKLLKDGIFIKESKDKTFARSYLELYTNDMPVVI